MEIETTPWYETRTLVSPAVEMLQKEGLIQYKGSFLKTESPRCATLKSRFVHYDTNYVKYCFLKEFYQLLFDSEDSKLTLLLAEVVTDFAEYCQKQSLEENPRELFRDFCKVYLFNLTAKT
ncbi:hypothetical protein QUB63_19445 [Microcoleus sp. ARI1-B5]|uniref:hypothetical protein n=1 Tax=unclassified Microcoleus TaxID=2642155 RepID=UPI002FD1D673